MFHPSANRLAGFLEISALSISLAQTGGHQAKAGFLRIEAAGHKGGGFGRKSAGWADKKRSRWCAVTESYLVVLDEPGEVSDLLPRDFFRCTNGCADDCMGCFYVRPRFQNRPTDPLLPPGTEPLTPRYNEDSR